MWNIFFINNKLQKIFKTIYSINQIFINTKLTTLFYPKVNYVSPIKTRQSCSVFYRTRIEKVWLSCCYLY